MKRFDTATIHLIVLILLLFASIADGLHAQPSLTTIADTVYNSVTGTRFNGSVIVQGPNFTSPAGIPVLGISRTVNIVNGAFTVVLVPNDTGSPAGGTYLLTFSNADKKTCSVPTSLTPVTLAGANCVDGSQQSVPITVALTQLASGGATPGQLLCFGGTFWAPCMSGGVATRVAGTATFAYSSPINDGACLQAPSTITATGVNAGDAISIGATPALAVGVTAAGKATATNTVTVELCNWTGGYVTPGSTTYQVLTVH